MTENSVRGAARSRGGAADTTMLIWKVIAANPGITRSQIWERVEHDIPAGFAIRRFARSSKGGAHDTAPPLGTARRFILNEVLNSMCRFGTLTSDGSGAERRFTAAREPQYRGNRDAIDETGTKAAEHMAVAEALRKVERLLTNRSLEIKIGRGNIEAIAVLVKALRARGPSAS